MKTVAFCALHYGATFLEASIRSVIDAVDQYVIVYTPAGSHGTRTSLPNPDTREELMRIANRAAGSKLAWYEGEFYAENQHRDTIFQVAPDADLIVVVDSDEVWKRDDLDTLISTATKGEARNYLAYEMAFWRSFYRAMPDKLCAPVRAINTRVPSGDQHVDVFFAHFGYAQPTAYIEYKMSLHGHRADWRPEWFAEKWQANAQTDLHPTNRDFWNARPVNPFDYVPEFMKWHPLFDCEVIP